MLTEQGVAVAGRTYRNWKKAAPSARTITDAGLTDALLATVDTPGGFVRAAEDDGASAPPGPSGRGVHRGPADG